MKFKIDKAQVLTDFHKIVGRWYIAVNNTHYLHSDLTINNSTLSNDGKYGGWYATREQARHALRSYKENNNT